MTKYTIKPITESSWILSTNGDKTAVISKTTAGIYCLGNILKKKFTDIEDLVLYLDNDVSFENPAEIEIEKEAADIEGFPIKHEIWHDIGKDPVPNYIRTKTSNIRYAAGYYGLKFANGWTASFCPKLSTLAEYEYIGPYKTKLEMLNSISQKNNLPKI